MLQPTWFSQKGRPRFAALRRNLKVDVVIIGGGITGLTAAYLLKRRGDTVAVLERDRCGLGDTGHTTAHLTAIPDRRLHQLARQFGRDHTRAVWESGDAAIQQVREIACTEEIDCDLRFVPAYVHACLARAQQKDRRDLQRELQVARDLDIPADFVDVVPGVGRFGVRFPNQALFHPLKYLAGVARAIHSKGSYIFEHSEAQEILDRPLAVRANGHLLNCRHVIIATHVPLMGKTPLLKATLLQTKIYPYSTYAIGAKVPSGVLGEGSYFDTCNPYYYLRIDRRRTNDYAILGGEDHKTGQVRTPGSRFTSLKRILRKLVPAARIDCQWSGQVIETNDGLPLIGQTAERQHVATGFAGNGMPFGTLAAMMISDAIGGRRNPWSALFDVHRKKLRGGTWNYLKEDLDYPYYMVKDRLKQSEGTSPRAVRRGHGAILRINGQRVAASRSSEGTLHLVSPVCTHMGCLLHWNSEELTWDCPCHGSRFHPQGDVLGGPAEDPLGAIDVRKHK